MYILRFQGHEKYIRIQDATICSLIQLSVISCCKNSNFFVLLLSAFIFRLFEVLCLAGKSSTTYVHIVVSTTPDPWLHKSRLWTHYEYLCPTVRTSTNFHTEKQSQLINLGGKVKFLCPVRSWMTHQHHSRQDARCRCQREFGETYSYLQCYLLYTECYV